MNTKFIFAAAAIAVSMSAASSMATAKPIFFNPIINCAITNTCPPPKPIFMPIKPINMPILPLPMPKPQGPNLNLNVDLGGGYDGGYNDGISCGEGRSIVRHHGYKKVHAVDCSGDVYTYAAKKHGQFFDIDVDMSGEIVDVSDASY